MRCTRFGTSPMSCYGVFNRISWFGAFLVFFTGTYRQIYKIKMSHKKSCKINGGGGLIRRKTSENVTLGFTQHWVRWNESCWRLRIGCGACRCHIICHDRCVSNYYVKIWSQSIGENYKTSVAFLLSQTKTFQAALFRVTKHLFFAIRLAEWLAMFCWVQQTAWQDGHCVL